MTKSGEEEYSKQQFSRFISNTRPATFQKWREGDEPPDFYLTLDETEYAVEVTQLIDKVVVGTLNLPTVAIIRLLWDFVDEVEEIARTKNILHGAYVVRFFRPITEFKEVQDTIQENLLQYIERTQTLVTAPEETVFKRRLETCKIEKIEVLENRPSRIHKSGPGNGKWEGQVETEICSLLSERINNKHLKLQKLYLPKILLLYDAYHFADNALFLKCIPKLSLLTQFHTIFISQINSDGFILYSQNASWA